MGKYQGHLGGKYAGPLGIIQENFKLADFVDGGGTDGVATFADTVPAGCIIQSVGIEVVTGFTGTAAVTAAFKIGATTFGAGALVLTTGGDAYVGETDATPPAITLVAGTLTLVASDTVDWGVVITGAVGEVYARVVYEQVASIAGR